MFQKTNSSIKSVRIKLGAIKLLYKETYHEFSTHLKLNASFNMLDDKQKMEARIEIGIHGIEKGLSFRTPKKKFGISKVDQLLNFMLYYQEKYCDANFINRQLPTLQAYLEFNTEFKESLVDIRNKFGKLTESINFSIVPNATIEIKKDYILSCLNFDYEKFVKARHSFRYFSNEPISTEDLKKALQIAQQAPTACNRQAQNVYLFTEEKKNRLLKLQGGSIGFLEEIDTAILITVDQKKYFMNELHQCYVDGGLYAMELLHALHYMGLATIPLTVSKYMGKERESFYKDFGIPACQAPILIIGVGNMPSQAMVNKSERKNYAEITTIIK